MYYLLYFFFGTKLGWPIRQISAIISAALYPQPRDNKSYVRTYVVRSVSPHGKQRNDKIMKQLS